MMRLRALRVKAVGCFNTAIALEGLGDGLNVLSGRNELGKSTLLKALRIAFEKKHTSSDEIVAELQPYAGGSPLVEVDFDTAKGSWRLRKQYLHGKFAELTDLRTGASWRNNDVQGRLDDLLQRGPRDLDRFDMLWIEQGAHQALLKKPKDLQDERVRADRLAGLLTDEIEALSVDAPAQRVRAQITKLLGDLQTDKGRPKKGGRWQLAVDAIEINTTAAAIIAEKAKTHAERFEQLRALIEQRATLEGPAGLTALITKRDTATTRHEQAIASQRAADAAKKTLETRFAELKLAEQTALAFAKTDAEITILQGEIRAATATLEASAAALTNCAAQTEVAAGLVAEISAKVIVLEQTHAEIRRLETAVAGHAEHVRTSAALASARSALADQDRAAAQVAALAHISPAGVAELETAMGDQHQRDASFAGIAPEVSIALEAAAYGKIQVDGRPLAGNIVLNPDRPLDIVIAGIGRIRIAPHPATANAEAQLLRAAAHARVRQGLADLRVPSLADAKAALAARTEAEHRIQAETLRLSMLAPKGIDALIAAHAASLEHAADVAGPPRNSAEIEKDLASARIALATADTELKRAGADSAKHERDRATLQAALDVRAARLATLTMSPAPDTTTEREAAAAAHAAAKSVYTDAHVAFEALRERAATVDPITAAVELREADAALADARETQMQLQLQIKGIESALEVESNEDIGGEQDRQQAALEDARRHLADVEEERAALALLADQFEAMAAAGRAQISAPVRARIAPYLASVLPGATLDLDAGFAPNALTRGTASEQLQRLSQGTREQIAIITRLGLGKLLADNNAAVPLILDDALVYTDDERIEAMFGSLALAAVDHQVLVFTCRSRSFASLLQLPRTTTLHLQAWQPEATASLLLQTPAA